MIPKKYKFFFLASIIALSIYNKQTYAQGSGDPLTIQGINHMVLHSAASRAMGGTTIGIEGDAGLMFTNPALLQTIDNLQISIGGLQQYSKIKQIQQYTPLKYYSNFSLLMEGLTGYIPDPDSLHPGSNPGDTVQRPFDTIGPNWSRSENHSLPIQAVLSVPFSINEKKFTFGLGTVEYADLNHYYQNNNVIFPSIGTERPVPIQLPPNNPDSTIPVKWYQYYRSREGSIRGYGAAISGAISDKIHVGISGMFLSGSTDDFQYYQGRGKLVFFYNYFRLDSVYYKISEKGKSDYSGQEFTLSAIYRGTFLSLGFSVKPPTKITREYETDLQVDTTGTPSISRVSGKDHIKLPWRGMIGLTIKPMENIIFGMEYEIRPYSSAVYSLENGTTSNPWLSSSLIRLGVEFRPLSWFSLRSGMRGEAEVFEPAGNPIVGEPVTYTVYSIGGGVSYSNFRFNLTYEYQLMKYQDMWQTNVNLNSEKRHCVVLDVNYSLPRFW